MYTSLLMLLPFFPPPSPVTGRAADRGTGHRQDRDHQGLHVPERPRDAHGQDPQLLLRHHAADVPGSAKTSGPVSPLWLRSRSALCAGFVVLSFSPGIPVVC